MVKRKKKKRPKKKRRIPKKQAKIEIKADSFNL